MLRLWIRRFWPTFLIAGFFLAALIGEISSPPNTPPSHVDQAHSNHQNTSSSINDNPTFLLKLGRWADSNHDAIEALSAIGVFILTLVLASSTIGLWIVTRIAADAAKDGADAAKTAAEAALAALDRPWLHIESLRNILNNPTSQTERPIAGFKITNHGKAPASILSIKAILFYSPGRRLERDFPIKPLPATMRDFPKADILVAFRYKNSKDPVDPTKPGNITRKRVENIVIPISYTTREFCFPCEALVDISDKGIPIKSTVHLYLMGHIIYTMPHEATEILSFCYEAKWRGEFSPIYGAPYNERKKAD